MTQVALPNTHECVYCGITLPNEIPDCGSSDALNCLRLRLDNASATIDAQAAEIARLREALQWRSMDTVKTDGTNVLLLTTCHGAVEAWYSPGSWTLDTPIAPAEYDGPVWVCADDAFEIEVEETPEGLHHGTAIRWMPIPPNDFTTQESKAIAALQEPKAVNPNTWGDTKP